jgi:hypothetical protein
MDQQAELIKVAAFYDELEKIAALNPELYELLKQAGLLGSIGGIGRGISRGLSRGAGRINDLSLKGYVGAQNKLHGLGKQIHKMPGGKAIHTGLHAGAEGTGHALSSTGFDLGALQHGAEYGLAGMGLHAGMAGARAAAPAIGRLGQRIGAGTRSLVGRLRPAAQPAMAAAA